MRASPFVLDRADGTVLRVGHRKLARTSHKAGRIHRNRVFRRPELPAKSAENARYPDLLPANELIIQGVMIGLLRTHTN